MFSDSLTLLDDMFPNNFPPLNSCPEQSVDAREGQRQAAATSASGGSSVQMSKTEVKVISHHMQARAGSLNFDCFNPPCLFSAHPTCNFRVGVSSVKKKEKNERSSSQRFHFLLFHHSLSSVQPTRSGLPSGLAARWSPRRRTSTACATPRPSTRSRAHESRVTMPCSTPCNNRSDLSLSLSLSLSFSLFRPISFMMLKSHAER